MYISAGTFFILICRVAAGTTTTNEEVLTATRASCCQNCRMLLCFTDITGRIVIMDNLNGKLLKSESSCNKHATGTII